MRMVIMSQDYTQQSMQVIVYRNPSLIFQRTSLKMTVKCQCMPEVHTYASSQTHSNLRLWFPIKAPASTNTPLAEILLFLRLQKVREQKGKGVWFNGFYIHTHNKNQKQRNTL